MVNSLICKAKGNYIKLQLNQNNRNPITFWRIIKNMLAPRENTTASTRFRDSLTDDFVDIGSEADFLNNYFINIVRNLDIMPNDVDILDVYNVDTRFCFLQDLPTVNEIVKIIKCIDVNKSGCVDNPSFYCMHSRKRSFKELPKVTRFIT